MKLEEYCDILNIKFTVCYNKGTWTAKFENCEIKDGSCLSVTSTFGKTPNEAINKCVEGIRGQTIVVFAYCNNRREHFVPETLVYCE